MLLELPVDPPLVLTAVVSEEPKPFVVAGGQVCRQFREACARGAVGDVEGFLQLPLDPNARELRRPGPRGTPLQEAVSGRNLALVQCLLKARADPNARTSSGGYSDDRPVAQAALHAVKGPYFDRAEILKALVHARADVTETLFPVLARTGSEHNESREQVVRMLLDAGARPVHKAYVTKYEDGPSSTLELAERFPAILAMLHSAMTPQTRQQHLQEQLGRRLLDSLQKDRGRWFDSV